MKSYVLCKNQMAWQIPNKEGPLLSHLLPSVECVDKILTIVGFCFVVSGQYNVFLFELFVCQQINELCIFSIISFLYMTHSTNSNDRGVDILIVRCILTHSSLNEENKTILTLKRDLPFPAKEN